MRLDPIADPQIGVRRARVGWRFDVCWLNRVAVFGWAPTRRGAVRRARRLIARSTWIPR